MRKMLFGIVALVLTISSASYGQHQGTGMLSIHESDGPAMLVQMTHTVSDFLQAAILKNVSDHPIVGYRIGWVAVYPSGRTKIGLGLPVDVPEGIKPGNVVTVPAQQVSPAFAREGAIDVVFFVAEVRSMGGPVWKPTMEKVEREARELSLPSDLGVGRVF